MVWYHTLFPNNNTKINTPKKFVKKRIKHIRVYQLFYSSLYSSYRLGNIMNKKIWFFHRCGSYFL